MTIAGFVLFCSTCTAHADTGGDVPVTIDSVPVVDVGEPIELPSSIPQAEPRTLLDDLTPEPLDVDPQILQTTAGPADGASSPILIPALPAALSGGIALVALSSCFRRLRRFIA